MGALKINRLKSSISGAILGGKGQILLLLILLSSVITARFVWFSPGGIPLDRVGYTVETSGDQGAVLFSKKGGEQQLILEGENLHWKSGGKNELIAGQVVNLHFHQGRIWVMTRSVIYEVNMQTGTGSKLLSVDDLDDKGMSFKNSRLVGVEQDGRLYLIEGEILKVINGKGLIEGPYLFDGRRTPKLVEPDWRTGVVFMQGNSWILYINLSPQEPVRLDYQLGELQEVLLSPTGSHVVYALQQGQRTEVWYSRANGTNPQLLYHKDKIYSNLQAMWSPDSSLVVLTVLGYETDASYDDNFISSTLLFQPGQQGTVALSRSFGPEVKALIPTAWDSDAFIIWFYWMHEEQIMPVSYSLFRR
jgi:hypothetical protein